MTESERTRILEALRTAKTPFTAQIARDLGIPERDLFRALPEKECTELSASRTRDILKALGECERVYLIVKSEAAVLEAESSIAEQREAGGYYNLMGNSVHAHVNTEAAGSVFAVHRNTGTSDPMAYSLQFFGMSGNAVLKIYLVRDETQKRYRNADLELFSRICSRFHAGME
jgi:putative heme utilization carrier protein HutX